MTGSSEECMSKRAGALLLPGTAVAEEAGRSRARHAETSTTVAAPVPELPPQLALSGAAPAGD